MCNSLMKYLLSQNKKLTKNLKLYNLPPSILGINYNYVHHISSMQNKVIPKLGKAANIKTYRHVMG